MRKTIIVIASLIVLALAAAAASHFLTAKPGKKYVVDCRKDKSTPLPNGMVADTNLPCTIK
jgi:flagellar basal body-associated protein FliL